MRRSVREAIVGISVLAAISGALGLWFWVRGLSIGLRTWRLSVRLEDAAGLAERSPVMYRGVMVGSVRRIEAGGAGVQAELEITDPELALPLPVEARVSTNSVLGGDAMLTLMSSATPLPSGSPGPLSRECAPARQLCNGARISGSASASISSVADLMQGMLEEADRGKLLENMISLSKQFDGTSREATRFLQDGRVLVGDLRASVRKADPSLANLNRATAEADASLRHLRRLLSALDNPTTVAELKATVANAEKLTARWQSVGGDVNRLTADPQFMDGVRSVTIGLGRFFDELYPAQTAKPER